MTGQPLTVSRLPSQKPLRLLLKPYPATHAKDGGTPIFVVGRSLDAFF